MKRVEHREASDGKEKRYRQAVQTLFNCETERDCFPSIVFGSRCHYKHTAAKPITSHRRREVGGRGGGDLDLTHLTDCILKQDRNTQTL